MFMCIWCHCLKTNSWDPSQDELYNICCDASLWKRMYEKNDMEKTAKKARLEEVKERSTTKVKEEKTPPRRK